MQMQMQKLQVLNMPNEPGTATSPIGQSSSQLKTILLKGFKPMWPQQEHMPTTPVTLSILETVGTGILPVARHPYHYSINNAGISAVCMQMRKADIESIGA